MQTAAPASALPLDRFQEELSASGMNDEAVAFLLGRMTQQGIARALEKAKTVLGDDWQTVTTVSDEETQKSKLRELYQAKTGSTFEDLVAECVEELVQEFEASAE